MSKPDPILFSLQTMMNDLALIDRAHYIANTPRRENDIEHSMTVTMLCWYIHDKYSIDLDITKILKYAVAHDFVERYAGDTNTFANSDERQAKVEREAESLERLSNEFTGFSDLVATMRQYESKADEEAIFVWTVDKMQALIMGDIDKWRPYEEMGISYDRFCKKYSELLVRSSRFVSPIFHELIEYCKTTYYDRPS